MSQGPSLSKKHEGKEGKSQFYAVAKNCFKREVEGPQKEHKGGNPGRKGLGGKGEKQIPASRREAGVVGIFVCCIDSGGV